MTFPDTETNEAAGVVRLLRIDISPTCNYKCVFCCWHEAASHSPRTRVLPPDWYRLLIEAVIHSRCYIAHFTGGEPLAIHRERLCRIIKEIMGVKGLRHFYITTNGSYLDDDYCDRLRSAGLRYLNVSIGAADNRQYKSYARPNDPDIDLDFVLSRVRMAITHDLEVSVHVPLMSGGIDNYDTLCRLIEAVQGVGVRRIGFFKLNKTNENSPGFFKLYDPAIHPRIVKSFSESSEWDAIERHGYLYFTNGLVECDPFLPLLDAGRHPRCRNEEEECELYCQGTYSTYFLSKGAACIVRACHRVFDDGRNEFVIPQCYFRDGDVQAIAEVLSKSWRWTVDGG